MVHTYTHIIYRCNYGILFCVTVCNMQFKNNDKNNNNSVIFQLVEIKVNDGHTEVSKFWSHLRL